jgi:hypothetical protein
MASNDGADSPLPQSTDSQSWKGDLEPVLSSLVELSPVRDRPVDRFRVEGDPHRDQIAAPTLDQGLHPFGDCEREAHADLLAEKRESAADGLASLRGGIAARWNHEAEIRQLRPSLNPCHPFKRP